MALFDHDILAMTPGTMRVGGSRMRCWVTASSKDLWWYDDGRMHAELTVHADDPTWTRERTLQFRRVTQDAGGADLDYPHDYPHDWMGDDVSSSLVSPFGRPCAARITVYGPAVNPYVIIGGNRYQGDATVPDRGLSTAGPRSPSRAACAPTGRTSSPRCPRGHPPSRGEAASAST